MFETFFSIYRRKLVRGKSAGHPDALHLHQIVYLRLARVSVGSRDPRDITQRNSAVAKYVWAATAAFILATLFVWRNTQALIALALMFCGAYVWLYLLTGKVTERRVQCRPRLGELLRARYQRAGCSQPDIGKTRRGRHYVEARLRE